MSIKFYYVKHLITGMHGRTCEVKEARALLEIFLPLLSYFSLWIYAIKEHTLLKAKKEIILMHAR